MNLTAYQPKFNAKIERELADRRLVRPLVCQRSVMCVSCDSFYVPDENTANGLCGFCTMAQAA
jgi:hypothetical protein